MARPMWLFLLFVGLELLAIRKQDYEWLQEKFISSHWIVKFIVVLLTIQLAINFSQDSVQPFIYTYF